jgi:hypothetical protein
MRCLERGLTAAVVLAVTTGCSIAGRADTPNIWVGSGATEAVMIQLTRSGNALSGTLDDTNLDRAGGVTPKTVHAAFTGTVDRTAITLTFPQGLGFSTSLSGTLTDATAKGWTNRGSAYRTTVAELVKQATSIADQAVSRYC